MNHQKIVDIGILNGIIVDINHRLKGKGDREIEIDGRLVVPGFVDLHMHLDKAWIGGSDRWECITLLDMIAATREFMRTKSWKEEEIMPRVIKAVELCVRKGTTAMRTHVDLEQGAGIEGIKAVLKAREQVKPWVDMQVVAFSLDGFRGAPDGGESLLRQALDLGADIIGGNPIMNDDPSPYFDMLFKVARDYNMDLDIHIDETNDPGERWVELLAEKTIEYDWVGRVTASHVCSLYWLSDKDSAQIIAKMAQAQMKVITNPLTNLYIRGKDPRIPTGPTRVKELLDGGIEVGIGTDNTGDFFAPLGNADMLLAALFLAYQRRLGNRPVIETVLNMATEKGAEFMGFTPGYGVAIGKRADLVVLDAQLAEKALIDVVPRYYVIKQGKIIVEQGDLTTLHYS
jgi:cytosine deaminase